MSLPISIIKNPHISSWIKFEADGSIELRTGKVELGQGIATSLTQIAADELMVDFETIRLVGGNTISAPDEGWTSASISIEVGGRSIRIVCALVRQLFTAQAAKHFGANTSDIKLSRGMFSVNETDEAVDYYTLSHDIDLHQKISEESTEPVKITQRYVGQSTPRNDILRKISGAAFIQDFSLPGMLHARVLRGPNYHSVPISVDAAAIRSLPGIQYFVRNGKFIAICGDDEALVAESARQVPKHIIWSQGDTYKLMDANQYLRSGPSNEEVVHQKAGANLVRITREFRATYTKPFLAHASIGTVCAVASFDNGQLHVWTQSQGVFPLRDSLAKFFRIPEEQVCVTHIEGAGCYGHNGADDVALDASLIAASVQKPVRVVWSRSDELTVSPMGSAMSIDLYAGLDEDGRIISWRSKIFSFGHLIRPGWGETVNLLASTEIDPPFPAPQIVDPPMRPFGGGAARNAVPLYNFNDELVSLNLITDSPVRTSALRSLGAYANVYAIESFIEEIAFELNVDAIKYRLSQLTDSRAQKVIEAVVNNSASDVVDEDIENFAHGFGFAQYKNCGAYFAVKVEVDLSEGIRVRRVWSAVDAGLVINPDGVKNQIEGGIIQAISWTLKEKVEFNETGNKSASWESYDILRFGESPEEISVEIVNGSQNPSLGVGECAAGPTAAAIGNAIFNALGVRIRDLPITYEKLVAQLI